jgi:hypothetical protein
VLGRAPLRPDVIWRPNMEREIVIKVQGRGVDDDAATILVYRLEPVINFSYVGTEKHF